MSRLPIKEFKSIKKYCEDTNCIECVFGGDLDKKTHSILCKLKQDSPRNWKIDKGGDKE